MMGLKWKFVGACQMLFDAAEGNRGEAHLFASCGTYHPNSWVMTFFMVSRISYHLVMVIECEPKLMVMINCLHSYDLHFLWDLHLGTIIDADQSHVQFGYHMFTTWTFSDVEVKW